jgi:hypothetical protein
VHLGTSGGKRLGGGIGPSEAEHLMARVNEFLNDGRTNETGSTGDEYTHNFSYYELDRRPQCIRWTLCCQWKHAAIHPDPR